MDEYEQMRRSLKDASTQTVNQIGIVVSVDKPKAICTVKLADNEELIYENVRLQAIDDEQDNGEIKYPKVESSVIISKIDNTSFYYVSSFSEIQEIVLKINGKEIYKMTENSIVFYEGTKGSLVEIAKLKAQLNKLEQSITQLKNVFSVWVPAPNDGGAALRAAVASWSAQTLAQTTIADIENTKIKQ